MKTKPFRLMPERLCFLKMEANGIAPAIPANPAISL
jgi:hypothetical protein